MAIKNDAASRARTLARWKEVREDLLAEYYLVSLAGNVKDNTVRLDTDPKTGNSMNLEFLAGVPVISFRKPPGQYGEEVAVGFIGDSMGVRDVSMKLLEDPALRPEGNGYYAPIEAVLSRWDDVKSQVDGQMKAVRERYYPKEQLEEYLFGSIVLGDDPFDRASFYGATKDMSRRERFDMRESLTVRVQKHFERGIDMSDPDEVRRCREKIAVANRAIDGMFGDWHRLGGRLDWRVMGLAAGRGEAGATDIAKTALWALREPEYAAYRQKTLPKWIENCSKFHGVDPAKVMAMLPKPKLAADKTKQVKM